MTRTSERDSVSIAGTDFFLDVYTHTNSYVSVCYMIFTESRPSLHANGLHLALTAGFSWNIFN